jgi:hypothetical protein
MKKFGNLKLLSLVFILMGALIFIGINLLDAQVHITKKKPKPPESTWKVAIPECSDCNLYGVPYPDGNYTYEDEDERVYVIVEKKKSGKAVEYLLRLFIYHSVFDGVCEELLYPHQIGFQGLDLVIVPHSQEDYWVVPEEFPCFFPNYYVYEGDCYPEDLQSEEF